MRGVKGIYSPVFYDETKSGDLGAQIHGLYILPRGVIYVTSQQESYVRSIVGRSQSE